MLLETEQLVCTRGGRALFAPVSLKVAAGGACFIEGPNGSGKSTLLRALAGLFTGHEGRITRHAPVFYLGHKNALQPGLTAGEHILFWKKLLGCAADATALLSVFGIEALAPRRIEELSQGQRRRLALTRLAMNEARLWLLDEPHAALDAAGHEFLQTLIARHRAAGGGVIMASHGGLPLPDAPGLKLVGAA